MPDGGFCGTRLRESREPKLWYEEVASIIIRYPFDIPSKTHHSKLSKIIVTYLYDLTTKVGQLSLLASAD